ncbi:DUF3558 domain-containing protein [Streptomyces sp. NPDC006879]|uniref:DUF3558 domain-containing protein n=1 Tax=Streptomyces sp. NPDC006879 TaxID=3364767 RepID=UPI00367370A0
MQRKTYFRSLAALGPLLLVALTGCTSGSADGSGNTDSKSDGKPVAAPPGKYQTLPEPCGSPSPDQLKALLPTDPELTAEQRDRLYTGHADPSYDGDRRVGCRWKAQAPEATRLLYLGYERVVSYDRGVSDDDKARQVYTRQLTTAQVPQTPADQQGSSGATSPTARPSASANPSASSGTPTTTTSRSPSPTTTTGAPAALGSRLLEDLGEEGFLDDRLTPVGPTTQSRKVHVVFRSSNVIVTVTYTIQPTAPATAPDGVETQQAAVKLAQALAGRFDE